MSRLGLLLTMTEPPAGMEEEFNAWYDTEHLAERLAIPGFRSAKRWVADLPPGEGKYLATYELDSAGVLESEPYLRSFNKPTPWSRRCLGKAIVYRRWACEQTEPGDAGPHAAASAIAMSADDLLLPKLLQKRRFAASSGEAIFLHELADGGVDAPAAVRIYRAYDA